MKTNKLLYGIVAFTPLLMVLVLFMLMGMMFMQLATDVSSQIYYKNEFDVPFFGAMMFVGVLTSIASISGLVLYIMHSQRNIHIPQEKRTMWLIIILLAGSVGKIIYFFSFIAKEDELNAKNQLGF